jgi:lactoylglutathione lyase|tara:strand:+ start:2478 stop:2693 length:216 start_codon:yes stop_codon:yes gene_type:complete
LLIGSGFNEERLFLPTAGVIYVAVWEIHLAVKDLDKSVSFFTEVSNWRDVGGYPDYPSKFVTDGNLFLTLW